MNNEEKCSKFWWGRSYKTTVIKEIYSNKYYFIQMSLEKKRVAIITERIYPFYHGGAEEVMYNYAKIFSKNYDVTVFTSYDIGAAQKKLNNVNFRYISKKINKSNRKGNHSLIGIFLFSVSAYLQRKLVKGFDLVLLDSIHYFYPNLFLEFLKRHNGKLVTIFHEAWYNYRKSGAIPAPLSYFMGISIRRLVNYSDKLISVSDPTTNSLINNYDVEKKKVITIPLGIDFEHMKDQYSFKCISDRVYDLVFVGRFATIKRVSDIVEAVSILGKKGKNLEVALIGEGPQRGLIEKKIENLGVSKSFHIFGFVDENEKYCTMGNSKIFILPSEREGFSISTLEAMALGCIPIVSRPRFDDVFGVSHFVKNNENGIYYNVGNVNELALSISKLLEDSEFIEKMSSKAIETARLFSIDKMAQKINDAIEFDFL